MGRWVLGRERGGGRERPQAVEGGVGWRVQQGVLGCVSGRRWEAAPGSRVSQPAAAQRSAPTPTARARAPVSPPRKFISAPRPNRAPTDGLENKCCPFLLTSRRPCLRPPSLLPPRSCHTPSHADRGANHSAVLTRARRPPQRVASGRRRARPRSRALVSFARRVSPCLLARRPSAESRRPDPLRRDRATRELCRVPAAASCARSASTNPLARSPPCSQAASSRALSGSRRTGSWSS